MWCFTIFLVFFLLVAEISFLPMFDWRRAELGAIFKKSFFLLNFACCVSLCEESLWSDSSGLCDCVWVLFLSALFCFILEFNIIVF